MAAIGSGDVQFPAEFDQPREIPFATTDLLERHDPAWIDIGFTPGAVAGGVARRRWIARTAARMMCDASSTDAYDGPPVKPPAPEFTA